MDEHRLHLRRQTSRRQNGDDQEASRTRDRSQWTRANGESVLKTRIFFTKIFGGHKSFLWGYWYPYFGLLVTSPLGVKARVGTLIRTWRRRKYYTHFNNSCVKRLKFKLEIQSVLDELNLILFIKWWSTDGTQMHLKCCQFLFWSYYFYCF